MQRTDDRRQNKEQRTQNAEWMRKELVLLPGNPQAGLRAKHKDKQPWVSVLVGTTPERNPGLKRDEKLSFYNPAIKTPA